jgi:hypothetical protein
MQQALSANLDSVLREVKTLVEELLAARHAPIPTIPERQGAYLIYDKNGSILYVGKGKKLKRRIQADHCGGDKKMSTSTFRRSVNKVYGLVAGRPVRDWVRSNCSFAFVEIPDPDLCAAVEAVTIRVLRLQGCKLMNK